MRARARGSRAERKVARHLRLRGWRILARNWRARSGEIDLVARRGRTLAFVEVKARAGNAETGEVLHLRQRRRIERAAEEYLARFGAGGAWNLRFDLARVIGSGSRRGGRLEYLADAWRKDG